MYGLEYGWRPLGLRIAEVEGEVVFDSEFLKEPNDALGLRVLERPVSVRTKRGRDCYPTYVHVMEGRKSRLHSFGFGGHGVAWR